MALNLRQRLALVLVGISVVVGGAMAITVWGINLWMQGLTLDHFMARELGMYIDMRRDPVEIDSEGLGLRYFRPARAAMPAVPEHLRQLGPGLYRDIRLGNETYYVLIRDVAPGDRAYFAYNVSAFKLRERWLSGVLLMGVMVTAVLAWLAGRWATARALRPLDSVVGRIRQLDPGARRQRLEPRPDDGELSVIVEAFNAYMNALDQVLERGRVFAAAAGHELRTPLTTIRGAAEILGQIPEVPAGPVQRIEQAVVEASRDLEALLALAEGREMPRAEPLDLDAFLRELARPYEEHARAQNTGMQWDIAAPVKLYAAPSVVSLIFGNLLRNALRAAPGGEVRVSLTQGRLQVSDNGEGIPADLLPRVFEPGTRGREGGSGLGLYIAHALARRCGWRLQIESREGVGTTVQLHLQP